MLSGDASYLRGKPTVLSVGFYFGDGKDLTLTPRLGMGGLTRCLEAL